MQNPINKIPNCSTKNQHQGGLNQSLFFIRLVKNYQDRHNGNYRNKYQEIRFKFGLLIRKYSESNTRVPNMGEIKKTLNNFYRIVKGNMQRDHELRVLINYNQRA